MDRKPVSNNRFPSGRLPSSSRGPLVAALAAILLVGAAGCTLDFDQFTADAGDARRGDSGPLDGTGDAPADGAVDGDAAVEPVNIGAACADGGSCGNGTCVNDYCTRSCESDRDCPGGSVCQPFGKARRCVVPCPEFGSCSVAGRSDIGCTRSARRARVGGSPDEWFACLPDSDDDRVHDGFDNCPETANAPQYDLDDDGEGNACDSNNRCPSAATDGSIDFGATPYEPQEFAAPGVVSGGWMPVAGGRIVPAGGNNGNGSGGDAGPGGAPDGGVGSDAGAGSDTGNAADTGTPADAGPTGPRPSDLLARLDFRSGKWKTDSKLPYATSEQAIASLVGDRRYTATPGNAGGPVRNLGRLLSLRPDGSTAFDGGFELDVRRPVVASSGDGTLVLLGYITDSTGQLERHVWTYRPGLQDFRRLHDTDANSARTWRVVRNRRGRLYFYTDTDPSSTMPGGTGRILEIDPDGSYGGTRTFSYPDVGSSGPSFAPIIVPGPGDQHVYAFDRRNGKAAVVDLADDEVRRQSDLDLSLPFQVLHAAVQPGGPILTLIGRTSGSDDQLRAKSYAVACHSAFSNFNSDSDRIPDMRDNCPTRANARQRDADRDGIGNRCDNDADNDGRNASEETAQGGGVPLTIDTDNDGTINRKDDDDDGDGIPDARDYYPFDTDNDGLSNDEDIDDDGDGYRDTDEESAGTDPLDPADFPGIGNVAFVQQTSDGTRVVKTGATDELGSANTMIPASYNPHYPRFFDSGDGLLALSGAPGEATSIVSRSNASGGTSERMIGRTLRRAEPASTDSSGLLRSAYLLVPSDSTQSTWEIVSRTFGGQNTPTLVGPLDEIVSFEERGGEFVFAGGTASCTGCLTVLSARSGDRPSYVGATPGRLLDVRFEGNRYAAIASISEGGNTRKQAFVGRRGDLDPLQGSNFVAVDSAVPLDFGGHLLVSARRAGGSFDIWLFNDRSDEWYRVLQSSDDLIEIDWIR